MCLCLTAPPLCVLPTSESRADKQRARCSSDRRPLGRTHAALGETLPVMVHGAVLPRMPRMTRTLPPPPPAASTYPTVCSCLCVPARLSHGMPVCFLFSASFSAPLSLFSQGSITQQESARSRSRSPSRSRSRSPSRSRSRSRSQSLTARFLARSLALSIALWRMQSVWAH